MDATHCKVANNRVGSIQREGGLGVVEIRFEPFMGHRLQVHENQLRDEGIILECTYSADGIMTFVTETGEYSFYYVHSNPSPLMQLRQLADGDWMLWGDGPRWAYVKEWAETGNDATRRETMIRGEEWYRYRLYIVKEDVNGKEISKEDKGEILCSTYEGSRITFHTHLGDYTFDSAREGHRFHGGVDGTIAVLFRPGL